MRFCVIILGLLIGGGALLPIPLQFVVLLRLSIQVLLLRLIL